MFKGPADQVYILRRLHSFIIAKHNREHDFQNEFIDAVHGMLLYLDNTMVIAFEQPTDLGEVLCSGLLCMLGRSTIINALFTVTEHAQHPPASFVALIWNTTQEVSLHLAAAMASRQYNLVGHLLLSLPNDMAHIVFGSPLLNAIKLRDITLLRLVIEHLGRLR